LFEIYKIVLKLLRKRYKHGKEGNGYRPTGKVKDIHPEDAYSNFQ
jgi:hypothetical protein